MDISILMTIEKQVLKGLKGKEKDAHLNALLYFFNFETKVIILDFACG